MDAPEGAARDGLAELTPGRPRIRLRSGYAYSYSYSYSYARSAEGRDVRTNSRMTALLGDADLRDLGSPDIPPLFREVADRGWSTTASGPAC